MSLTSPTYLVNQFSVTPNINTEFWLNRGSNAVASETEFSRTPTYFIDNVWNKIYVALDRVLQKYATVSICLQHLYPACQANPDFLKGEDNKLYAVLKDKYSIGVTTINLARHVHHEERMKYVGYREFGSKPLLDESKNILFVPDAMNEKSSLYSSDVCNHSEYSKEVVYLVAALVVSKK